MRFSVSRIYLAVGFVLAVVFLLVLSLWWMTRMPGHSSLTMPPALTDEELTLRDHLARKVEILAEVIGERNVGRYDALVQAANYIQATLLAMGYAVTRQEYVVQGKTVSNLEARIIGHSAPDDIVVLGAHYDSVAGAPGANDNATGIAALLELARFLAGRHLTRSVHLVAFVNEESPFFFTADMGSRRYASRARAQGENIVAMLSLEMLGYYTDAPQSQGYPPGLRFFYPDTGHFLGFVGNLSSRALVQNCIATFRRHTSFPAEGLAAPWWMPGVALSDQSSFWREGYPAIMVTDTGPYRYPYYHTAADTPQQIDFDRMAHVVAGLRHVVLILIGEEE